MMMIRIILSDCTGCFWNGPCPIRHRFHSSERSKRIWRCLGWRRQCFNRQLMGSLKPKIHFLIYPQPTVHQSSVLKQYVETLTKIVLIWVPWGRSNKYRRQTIVAIWCNEQRPTSTTITIRLSPPRHQCISTYVVHNYQITEQINIVIQMYRWA